MAKRLIYNRQIFDKIDCEEKAYWLGFIMADGYLNVGKNMVRIKLKSTDRDHLIKYANFLGGDASFVKEENSVIKETGNPRCSAYISTYSKEIRMALENLGVIQAKTGKEIVPKIPKEFMIDFWRGYFDGDGCIRTDLTGVSLSGSLEIIEGFQSFIKENLDIDGNIISFESNRHKTEYRAKRHTQLILNLLYKDSAISLDRKKELYNQLEKIC